MTPHKIIKSKRRTLSLSINENAELIVRAPNQISNKRIEEFIIEKSKWINKNKNLMQSRINEMNDSDSDYLFLGNIYPLIKVSKNPNKIDFNGTEFITSIENQDKFKASLKSWYKIKFKEIAIPRLNYFSDKYNLKINQVRFKNQKTLWGSCSSKNNINLNYLLVMAPMIVIDYVIIHELVHTVHKNHSENFWNAVEAIMPDYKKAKKWLNKNGYKLRNL
jgi:predicted metal-dependent hydrolase